MTSRGLGESQKEGDPIQNLDVGLQTDRGTMMQSFSIHPSTEPMTNAAGIQRAIIDGERMTLTRYDLDEGASFPRHRHPEEQMTLVFEGTMEFEVDGVAHAVGAGEVIVIAGGASHEAIAGRGGAKVACIVSPRRNDTSRVEMLD